MLSRSHIDVLMVMSYGTIAGIRCIVTEMSLDMQCRVRSAGLDGEGASF